MTKAEKISRVLVLFSKVPGWQRVYLGRGRRRPHFSEVKALTLTPGEGLQAQVVSGGRLRSKPVSSGQLDQLLRDLNLLTGR